MQLKKNLAISSLGNRVYPSDFEPAVSGIKLEYWQIFFSHIVNQAKVA